MQKKLRLTQGKDAIVDGRDFDSLSQYKWCYSNGYAMRRRSNSEVQPGESRYESMHSRIMANEKAIGATKGEKTCIIHLDGNRLNCRRKNLVKTTLRHRQQRRAASGKTSIKGVAYRNGKWIAHICLNGQTLHLGTYNTKEAAANVYDKAARSAYGKTAACNNLAQRAKRQLAPKAEPQQEIGRLLRAIQQLAAKGCNDRLSLASLRKYTRRMAQIINTLCPEP